MNVKRSGQLHWRKAQTALLDPVGGRWSRWSRPVRRGGARASGAGVTAYRGGLARRGQRGCVTPAFGEVGDSSNCLPPSPGRARALPETAGGRECLELPRRGAGRRPRDLCGVSSSPGPQTEGSPRVVMGKTRPELEVFPASRLSLLMPSRMLSVLLLVHLSRSIARAELGEALRRSYLAVRRSRKGMIRA